MSDTHSAPATGTSIGQPLPNIAVAPNAAESVKPRRISKRIRAACDALLSGSAKTITDAATLAKLSREHLSRELGKPHVTAYMQQKACRTLAIAAGRASAVKVELLDCESSHVRDSASTFVLGLAGIRVAPDAQVSVNIDIKAGYVIDLSEQPRRVVNAPSTLIEAQAVDNAGDGQ